jgi:tyrosinase
MGVRKSCKNLSSTEKRDFVAAVLALKSNGRYDAFVRTHNEFIMSDSDTGPRVGHRSPSFLPWHRRFLLDFEQALQSINPAVNLPYWDWTVDNRATGAPWTDDLLGGNGRALDGQVMTGPFAYSTGNWPITVRVDNRPYLRRTLGASGNPLPSAADVASVLEATTYDVPPFNGQSVSGFRNLVEGWRGPNLHNRVHVWVGGQMTSGVSPNDPVFWLHHCFIDKLWSDWQKTNPHVSYVPTQGTPNVVDLDEPMNPWKNVTPAQMLNHQEHYTYE